MDRWILALPRSLSGVGNDLTQAFEAKAPPERA